MIACSEDFLEKLPTSDLSANNLDITKIQELRNSVYGSIPGANTSFDTNTDNAYARNSWDSHGRLIQTNTVSPAQGFGYSSHYGSIRDCNILIAKLKEFDLDPELVDIYSAESKMMRAWQYMTLTLKYGDVPLVDTLVNDLPDGIAREDKEIVRSWVLTELQDAADVLPKENDPGKFNKGMAYALKARAAYYFGNYEIAESASEWVIANGGYSLFEVDELTAEEEKEIEFYKTLIDFDAYGLDEEAFTKGMYNFKNLWYYDNNSESIIAKEFVVILDEWGKYDFDRYASFLTPQLTDKWGWNIFPPVQQLTDSYWLANGSSNPTLPDMETRKDYYNELRDEIQTLQDDNSLTYSEAVASIKDELHEKDYLGEFKNRDSRLYASIMFPFVNVETYKENEYLEYIYSQNNYGQTGYVWKKFSGGDDVASMYYELTYGSGADWHLLRLTEMLLIYAEARTQNTGYDNQVTTELNKLRDRCGMPHVPTGLGKEDALDFIRRERRIELAGEGHRHYDIRLYEDTERNGGYKGKEAASAVMKGDIYDPEGHLDVTMTWDPRLLYLPIPTDARDKNPLLDQNDGY